MLLRVCFLSAGFACPCPVSMVLVKGLKWCFPTQATIPWLVSGFPTIVASVT